MQLAPLCLEGPQSPRRVPTFWRLNDRWQCVQTILAEKGRGDRLQDALAQPIYFKSGSMIGKSKTNRKHSRLTGGQQQSRPRLTLRKQSAAEADPVSFTRTHCYRHSFGKSLSRCQSLP